MSETGLLNPASIRRIADQIVCDRQRLAGKISSTTLTRCAG